MEGTWVRSRSGPRKVHWRQPIGVLLCSDAKVMKPLVVDDAELSSAGNPLGEICDLCLNRIMARDKPPTPPRTIEFKTADERWRHELQVGRHVVAVLPTGVIEGIITARDMAMVCIEVANSKQRLSVHVGDIYKIKMG